MLSVNEPISVVMAVYNGRKFLSEQVQSIQSQLKGDDELIIVDDASTDGSVASLEALPMQNVRLFTNPRNTGVLQTFERGLALANHRIVFLSDQDDIWLPGKRAAFVEAFERDSNVSLVISDAEVINEDGKVIAASFMANRGGFDGSLLGTLYRSRYLGCAMAVRRGLLEIALPIPRSVPLHDMWLGVIGTTTGRVVYLPTPYLRHRRHGNNLSPDRSSSLVRLLRWRGTLLWLLVYRLVSLRLGLHKRTAARS
jgi:glycosyltransferase involved in cell wall biosynthesis